LSFGRNEFLIELIQFFPDGLEDESPVEEEPPEGGPPAAVALWTSDPV
jgi:hypothetical protein